GSGISGKVSMSGGASGTTFVVSLNGLTPNAAYIASWSTTVACDMGTAPPAGAVWNFHGSKRGTASFSVSSPEAFSCIHSFAIQLTPTASAWFWGPSPRGTGPPARPLPEEGRAGVGPPHFHFGERVPGREDTVEVLDQGGELRRPARSTMMLEFFRTCSLRC